MDDKIKRIGKNIAIGFFILVVVIVIIFNIKNNTEFWSYSFTNVVSTVIAVVVAYCFVQEKNNERKMKEKADQLIEKVEEMVLAEDFYNISADADIQILMLNIRRLKNKMKLLEQCAEKLNFVSDIEYISKQVENYDEMVGEHISDLGQLSDASKKMQKIAHNIEQRCETIKINLCGFCKIVDK